MSETKPEASPKRRRFSEEFKQDAVRLVVREEYSCKAAPRAIRYLTLSISPRM